MTCYFVYFFFFFKQKTAYEIGTGDWSSDVCSSDLEPPNCPAEALGEFAITRVGESAIALIKTKKIRISILCKCCLGFDTLTRGRRTQTNSTCIAEHNTTVRISRMNIRKHPSYRKLRKRIKTQNPIK